MDKQMTTRIKEEAKYIINTKETLRNTAKYFNISKSTVHKDMKERLAKISPELDKEVKTILEIHLKERHIKGGMKTKEKYKKGRNNDEEKRICHERV